LSISETVSSYWFDSSAASARATTLSTRSRSLEETPVSRKEGSTPRRLASHSTVSPVGRVFPRSIWLTYSFELRLRQPAGDAELADALAHRVAGGSLSGAGGGELIGHLR